MKLNEKTFKNAKSQPFRTHEYKENKIELHYLDDNDFYDEYVNKGRMYVWTSDGKDYKLFIEKGYYEEGTRLFDDKINEIWIDYFNSFDETLKKIQRKYLIPGYIVFFIIFALVIVASRLLDKTDYRMITYVLYAVVFMGGFLMLKKLNKIRSNAIEEARSASERRIRKYLGKKEFETILKNVNAYREKFYAFDDEELNNEIKEINDENKNEEIKEEDNSKNLEEDNE